MRHTSVVGTLVVVLCACLACVTMHSPRVTATPIIPTSYPLFLQCDPAWGNDTMESSSICREGCAMSALSMALAGKGYLIAASTNITPGTLNAWLRTHDGYTCIAGDCNNLVLDAVNRLAAAGKIAFVDEVEKPAKPEQVLANMLQNHVYIAHVHNRGHFVLVTGFESTDFNTVYVNDPFYPSKTYAYDTDIADMLHYIIEANA
eukprot:EC687649.1.p2 GENE.EC687649.1~~EC687649.1.p2  ORF type:complete len:204 (+),score=70.41 EC687649.1:85-696(+)